MGLRRTITLDMSFGEILRQLRKTAPKGVSKDDVLKVLGITDSHLGMIERGKRGPIRDHQKIKEIVKVLEASVFERQLLLLKAGLDYYDIPRLSPEDGAEDQYNRPPTELWIVAEQILDTADAFYPTTLHNIKEGCTRYVFFQPNRRAFDGLRTRLCGDLRNQSDPESILINKLECILAPAPFFFASFSVANPGRDDMFGVVSLHKGGAISDSFMMDQVKLRRIYEIIEPIYCALKASNIYESADGRYERIFPVESID